MMPMIPNMAELASDPSKALAAMMTMMETIIRQLPDDALNQLYGFVQMEVRTRT